MNGLIIVNKPKGITSRDVVNFISKSLNIKKVGHNGTLDPIAEGVLVICLGKYTKLNNLLTSTFKEYIAKVRLGIETDSLDITGNIIKETSDKLNINDLKKTLNEFPKKYLQEVPKYSAVKINGKKLYEYARENIDVTLPKREVNILSLELINYNEKTFSFKTKVSKGTYIRSLIKDILNNMFVIGTMEELTRTKQGIFDIKDACSLEDIEKGKYKILKIKDVLDIQTVEVDENLKNKIINGCKIFGDYPDKVLFLHKNEELAIYKKEGNLYRVDVML